VPPTPVRLTRRALDGGPEAPSNAFSMTTQGHVVTSGRWDRSSPSLSTLCVHPRHCSATRVRCDDIPDAVGVHGDKTSPRPPLCRVRAPVDGTLEPACGGGRTTNHYTATVEAAPIRAQDAPRRPDWSRIRQDGRQLRGTARHATTVFIHEIS
jgi:hypothetical protein